MIHFVAYAIVDNICAMQYEIYRHILIYGVIYFIIIVCAYSTKAVAVGDQEAMVPPKF